MVKMTLRHTSLATALIVLFASGGSGQTQSANPGRITPDFHVQVWGDTVTDFNTRVRNYFELRSKLERGLPALTVTDDPAEIRLAQFALAKEIRVARSGAGQGEFFTLTMSVEFKRVLLLTMNAETWAAIMDDNPGEFRHQINGTYPDGKPFSTVPGTILALLPQLPDDIQFRFLGRHLILYDLRANVILDRIPYAVQCTDCDSWTMPLV
jgi:hypothetical protein